MSAISASDAWAVGGYVTGSQSPTLILHWDGTTWTQVPSPSPGGFLNELNGVHATSASDAWVVGISENKSGGSQTLIEHWDGTAWTQVPGPSPEGNFLAGVTATSARTAFAVGSRLSPAPRPAVERLIVEPGGQPSRGRRERSRGGRGRARRQRLGGGEQQRRHQGLRGAPPGHRGPCLSFG